MLKGLHNLICRLAALALIALIFAPGLAQADEAPEALVQWERLEHQRAVLMGELENLEREHQKFVESIENLKDQHARGEASRGELEEKLRQNLRTVRTLEQLQRQLREVDAEQGTLRGEILDYFDRRRVQLEQQLRQGPVEERAQLVVELNELQRQRSDYAIPLPEADQRRVDQALADARAVSEDHPRAMLSAADELEDTSDQLHSRLEGIQRRIDELERARALNRQSQQFGAFDRFFDEGERGRTIARFEQAVQTEEAEPGDSEPPPQRESETGGQAEEEFDSVVADADEDDFLEGDPMADVPPSDEEGNFDDPSAGFEDETVGFDEPEEPSRFDEPEMETIVIESEPADHGISYFSDREMERDLMRLQQERDHLEEQAEELRKKADELRRKAEESY